MSRKLVWVEQQRFRGWGCSECAWVFNSSGSPTGKSFDEAMRNFEVQRDKEFTLHVCARSPKSQKTEHKRDVKQDWEKLYRTAIIESDRSKLQHRVETQVPRFSSDHEVYQSRQPTTGKSRKLSLGPCTF
jgi:hypothetical protein